MISDGTFIEYECALSDDKHFINEPIILPSCGHSICRVCLPKESNSAIKCKQCGEITNRDLSNDKVAVSLKIALKRNIHNLLSILEKQMSSQINQLANCLDIQTSRTESLVQFMKEEIEIRVESMKYELDKLCDELKKELDAIKLDIVKSNNGLNDENNIDIEKFKICLNQLRTDIQNKQNQNEDKFYCYQDELRKLNKEVAKLLNNDTYELYLNIPNIGLKKPLVAEINYKNLNKGYISNTYCREKLKKGDFKIIDVEMRPFDISILPNNYMIFANRDDKKLTLCNEQFKIIKTIDRIVEKTFYPEAIALDDRTKKFYLTNRDSHEIIMTDLELNKLKSYGSYGSGPTQLNDPCGICFINDYIYVCDSKNKRIQILTADFDLVNSIGLTYEPWLIKASNDLVCIERNDGKGIDFYKLDGFSIIRNYNHGWGKISVINSHFFECCSKVKKIFCYDKSGMLIEEISIDRLESFISNSWDGYLFSFDKKLMMLCYNKRKIIQFN